MVANPVVCAIEYPVNSHSRRLIEKRVLRKAGSAVHDYRMIADGDRVLVAVSGGKDSIVLLKVLAELKSAAPVDFDLVPIHVATGFEKDFDRIQCWIRENLGMEVRVFDSGISEILAHSSDPEKSPCALCSRLRRGVLYTLAYEEKFTSIALGHHLDDIIETFFLRCLYTGQIGAMAPSRYSDDGRNRVIRPLASCKGALIEAYFTTFGIDAVKSVCPIRKDSKRQRVRAYISQLEKEIPTVRESVFSSLGNLDMKSLCLKEEPGAHPH